MSKDVFYTLTPPELLSQLRVWDVRPAHLAYRLSPGMRLMRLQGSQNIKGGIMVVGDCAGDPGGPCEGFCADVERECAARGFRGVLLDFDRRLPPLSQLVSCLSRFLHRRGITLFVPEYYAPLAPQSRVLISSAISGGSLALRLQEARDRFGANRVVLAVEKTAEDFLLPALTGCGTPLTPEQLEERKKNVCPTVFFSRELCARYFTYRDPDGGVHFVLFDDLDTISHKLKLARQADIHAFLLPWAEISPAPERLSIPRTDVPLPTCSPCGEGGKRSSHFSPKK